jgi:hypothetical protein
VPRTRNDNDTRRPNERQTTICDAASNTGREGGVIARVAGREIGFHGAEKSFEADRADRPIIVAK